MTQRRHMASTAVNGLRSVLVFLNQDMYQFVLSKEIMPPFTLFQPHPQTPIQLSLLANQSITGYENSLLLVIIETDKLDLNWLAYFEVTSYASCNCTINFVQECKNCDIDVPKEFIEEEDTRKDEGVGVVWYSYNLVRV